MHDETPSDDIAVIGMGCRYPGADGVGAFWELLQDGADAIREIPSERFDIDRYYDPRPSQTGGIVSRKGGFIDDIRSFDASYFGISGREAERMDPQQRMLLEVVHEALEDAAQRIDRLEGTETGVYVGMIASDYRRRAIREGVSMDVYTESGTTRAAASGRISHVFGLNGPSMTIDTACSSSLVATHEACESLRSGAARMAVVGGTNLILEPESSIAFSSTGMLATDGRCKFGDADGDGFVRSDGVGAVVLKPLELAERDGDPIRAVIRESGVNNDGRSGRGLFLTPSRSGQRELLEETYRDRDELLERLAYVEAHGTGTSAGDPVEIGALAEIVGNDRADDPLHVGSVKTNIGHTEGAAGLAGLIKSVLVLERREIPPSLHFETPNPEIPWGDCGVEIPTSSRELDPNRRPVVGVSSFGITGTNAHVVLEEYGASYPPAEGRDDGAPRILPVSGHTTSALRAYGERYVEFLAEQDERPAGERGRLTDVVHTESERRTHRAHRLAVVGRNCEEMARRLEGALEERSDEELERRSPKSAPVFVCSGQGGQWPGMGEGLLESERFAGAIAACDEVVRSIADWSVEQTLRNPSVWQDRVDRIQVLLFACQVALAEAWKEIGVEPHAVIGHSLGEVAAAHVAGALSLRDAAKVICTRSRLLRQIAGQGAMAVVGLDGPEVQSRLRELEVEVSVAARNHPDSTVVSGGADEMERVADFFDGRETFFRFVDVDVASHSRQVEPLVEDLVEELADIEPGEAEIPFYSTVEGERVAGSELGAAYWGDNLRRPVQFHVAARAALEDGLDAFVELGPHPVLSNALRAIVRESGTEAAVVPSLRREESTDAAWLEATADLYAEGLELDWRSIQRGGRACRLPRYPLQGEEYWFEPGQNDREGADVERVSAAEFERGDDRHPFLARQFPLGGSGEAFVWETELSTDRFWYLDEHRVRGSVVFPGSGYAEMAVAIGRDRFDDGCRLRSFEFDELLIVPENSSRRLQVVGRSGGGDEWELEFFSFAGSAPEDDDSRMRHASVTVESAEGTAEFDASSESVVPEEPSGESISAEDFYRVVHDGGIDNGPAFQGVETLVADEDRVVGRIEIPSSVVPEREEYELHPCVLDACFQLMGPLAMGFVDGERPRLFLPAGIGRMEVVGRPTNQMRGVVEAREVGDERLVVDIAVVDEGGEPILEIESLEARCIDPNKQRSDERIRDWFYEWSWHHSPGDVAVASRTDEVEPRWAVLGAGDGLGARLARRLRRSGSRATEVRAAAETRISSGDGVYEVALDEADAETFAELFDAVCAGGARELDGVLCLWSSTEDVSSESWFANVAAVQGLVESAVRTPDLWFVTRGVHAVEEGDAAAAFGQAPIWGFARVLRNEHPELSTRCLDLGSDPAVGDLDRLVSAALRRTDETELAVRDGDLYARRLEPLDPFGPGSGQRRVRKSIRADEQFELDRPGERTIDGLAHVRCDRAAPGAHEIEVDVAATGLNFADVVTAMGAMEHPVIKYGYECVGEVVRTGAQVSDELAPGTDVLVFAPSANCFGGYATLHEELAVPVPAGLNLREAATIPGVYITSHYALVEAGRLAEGERVLVHSASGGIGHAALHIAKRAGATIFATAGTPEKREYLRSTFDLEHVSDSRSLEFADEILDRTDGEGIDVVLNTLTGEGTERGMELLRTLGRFLDLSKADMYEEPSIGLEPFEKNLTYVGIDATKISRARPEFVGRMWEAVIAGFDEGAFRPLPVDAVFSASDVRDAFRYMRRGEHIGKIVVEQDEEVLETERSLDRDSLFRSDASYLLTGGTGGIGLEVADWMSARGAGGLVLISRSGADREASARIEEIRQRGTDVQVARSDVADRERMAEVVDGIRQTERPLRGVFHLAGVLRDRTIPNQDRNSFEAVFRPKVLGAWHLHELTRSEELEYFVLFSSAAGIIGSPGQANYAAANAGLDALARMRRRAGRPATSLDWGDWREVGLAAEREDRGMRLEARGLEGIPPSLGVAALEQALVTDVSPTLGVFGIDWGEWAESYPQFRESPSFSHLMPDPDEPSDSEAADHELARVVRASEPESQGGLVEQYLREEVSDVLGMSAAKIDFTQPVSRVGLDSLMAVELRVRLENQLGVELSSDAILEASDLRELTGRIVEELERI